MSSGDIQVNDTDYHRPLKSSYRENEMKAMLDLLKANPDKIPAPDRNEMMKMFDDAWEKVYERLDNVNVFKRNMMTIALDGSEDHLASRQLMDLVGKEMLEFREELLDSTPPASLKELRKKIIRPEGVKHKNHNDDEGVELFDGETIEQQLEDEEGSDGEAEVNRTEDANEEVNGEVTTPVAASVNEVVLLDEIGAAIKSVRSRSSAVLLPHLNQLEGNYLNSQRKLLKNANVDGILQQALVANVLNDDNAEEIPDPPPRSRYDSVSSTEELDNPPWLDEINDIDDEYDGRNFFDDNDVGLHNNSDDSDTD